METNWNQLIERYLQNELSEEGRSAFEQELQVNPELREELELHQLIQSAAKRASQRMMVQQTGKSYFRNLRIKQFAFGLAVTIVATGGILYWIQHKKQSDVNQSNQEIAEVSAPEKELKKTDDPIVYQPNQAGDKSSLIQSSDWNVEENANARTTVSFHTTKERNRKGKEMENDFSLKRKPVVFRIDTLTVSIPDLTLPTPTEVVLGKRDERSDGSILNSQALGSSEMNKITWIQMYDSVGKFNDLYCGYALVMDNAKFGFVDHKGNLFIPLIYDQIVVTVNIKSSKQKNKRQKRKRVLYIPKRSGKEVKDCEEEFISLERNRDSLR